MKPPKQEPINLGGAKLPPRSAELPSLLPLTGNSSYELVTALKEIAAAIRYLGDAIKAQDDNSMCELERKERGLT